MHAVAGRIDLEDARVTEILQAVLAIVVDQDAPVRQRRRMVLVCEFRRSHAPAQLRRLLVGRRSTIPTVLTLREEKTIPPSSITSTLLACVHSQRFSSGQIGVDSGSSTSQR